MLLNTGLTCLDIRVRFSWVDTRLRVSGHVVILCLVSGRPTGVVSTAAAPFQHLHQQCAGVPVPPAARQRLFPLGVPCSCPAARRWWLVVVLVCVVLLTNHVDRDFVGLVAICVSPVETAVYTFCPFFILAVCPLVVGSTDSFIIWILALCQMYHLQILSVVWVVFFFKLGSFNELHFFLLLLVLLLSCLRLCCLIPGHEDLYVLPSESYSFRSQCDWLPSILRTFLYLVCGDGPVSFCDG